ncbi:hypothetical protein BDV37DRAFT_280847 [Aspergillus pseudonomiae]|uniref:Uncharacterized protein n=1 Tax=Aspergillus pseudonomiae TaxID=1506151 RepID=A0A5N7DKQ4_9EURO|nr:uncharacterized protein BDV37DRAFT_280847 [Aspergillus pseudonomiae]KAE8406573.1 hypothetical protein BDV37DRAFT_280847 [Aspergillus pseudonomiae]
MQHESPMREMPIRVLSATLLGTHTISGQSIRILPSYAREVPGDVDKVFGGSLILMHLKSFHEGVTTSRNNDAEWSGIDWMRHVLLALKTFTDGFETVSEFLTNEQILELSGVLGNPKLEMIANILLAILNACKDKSDKDNKVGEKFKHIDMREKVELVQHTFKPVLTFGRVLSVIIEGIGDTYIPDSEMEQLSRVLLGVKGCMVSFPGAVGTILEQLKDEDKTGEIITIASWACIFLTSVAPPLGFLAIGSFIYHSEKACGKSRERGMLSALEAANTRIDMMTACTRLYVVLVVMKAGNFFDKGSRQYDEYRLLMREIFEMDIDEEANVSRYIKTTGQQICCHVKYVQGKVKMYTESYGVQPIEDNTDW